MRKIFLLSFMALILTGCMVGPDYQRPTVDAPPAWRFEEKAAGTEIKNAESIANTAWWEQLNDPVLNELIRIALTENKDVMIAAARVEEFAGRYGTTRAALFPQVGANAGYGRQQASELAGVSPIVGTGIDPYFNSSEFTLNARWEIDLWGKIRRATEAARADILASEEARRAVVLSLVSSVASAYIDLRDLDKQLEIAKETAKSREESYKLFKIRFEGGVISELELNQVKSEYEQALSTIPQFEKSIAQVENYISILLGRPPYAIARGRTIDQLSQPMIPAGLPSDILNNRPDIRQAEQNLIAANANIGVAKSLYYPSISLTGMLGYASNDLDELFEGRAKTWNFFVPVTAPIFTAGAIAGQVQAAEAIQQQALFQYQKSIQEAFREVDDALIDRKKSQEQIEALARQTEALQNTARIARLRYDNGYTSYIEVLDAERSLFSAELSYTQTQGTLFRSLVNLYKSMGGGWVIAAEAMTEPPPSANQQAQAAPNQPSTGGQK